MVSYLSYDSGFDANSRTRREFILPEIAYVNPLSTPLYSILNRPETTNVLTEWVLGNINFDHSATTVNAHLEGLAASALTPANNKRYRMGSHQMINEKIVDVSRTQRKMDEVGVSDELSHQIWEESLVLAQENERNLLWSTDNAGSSSVARQTSGMWDWLTAFGNKTGNITHNGYTVPDDYSTYLDEVASPMTRDRLNNLTEGAWEQGMNLDNAITFVGKNLKRLISGFGMVYSGSGATLSAAPLNERDIPAAAKTLIDRIDIYEGDFGTLYVNKNRYLTSTSAVTINSKSIVPANSMLIFEPSYFEIREITPISYDPLAKDGDRTRSLLVSEYGLVCRNPKAIVGALNAA
jgi:hypothetical protein